MDGRLDVFYDKFAVPTASFKKNTERANKNIPTAIKHLLAIVKKDDLLFFMDFDRMNPRAPKPPKTNEAIIKIVLSDDFIYLTRYSSI